MSRVAIIVGLVGCMMAGAVAFASPAEEVRLPVTVSPPEQPGRPEPRTGASGDSVIVVRGDHLWKISAEHLGTEASDHQIAPYWRQVITLNTPHLRSGDPDLIYPGELVDLPPIP